MFVVVVARSVLEPVVLSFCIFYEGGRLGGLIFGFLLVR